MARPVRPARDAKGSLPRLPLLVGLLERPETLFCATCEQIRGEANLLGHSSGMKNMCV